MSRLGLIGPLAGWELRRLVRSGLALRLWLLLLYVLILTLAVYAALWVYPRPPREAIATLSRLTSAEADAFVSRFALVFLQVQLVALVALTPGLAASAVAEEKDRHTLPLLLTTQLTDREIVFGKAAGRIALMLAVITAGLPLLALLVSVGTVDVAFLLTGYAITLGTVALCSAVGMNAACQAPDFRSALLRGYGHTAALMAVPLACGVLARPLVLASPFAWIPVLYARGEGDALLVSLGCFYPVVQVLLGLVFLVSAARALRLREPSAGPLPVSAFPLPPRPADPPLLQTERAPRPPLPPLDASNPVLWKERCAGWRPTWAMPSVAKVLAVLIALAALLLFAVGAALLLIRMGSAFDSDRAAQLVGRSGAPDNGGWLLTAAGVFAAGRYLLPLAVGLSGAIAGERFRGTLDALLSTPLDRRMILRAKVQAHAERGTVFAAFAVAAVGMAFTADADVGAGASAAALVLGGVALVIGLGAWLTVRCATDVRAFRVLLLFAMLAVGWPAGVWHLLRSEDVPQELLTQAMLTAGVVTAAAGATFWWLAERRLARGE